MLSSRSKNFQKVFCLFFVFLFSHIPFILINKVFAQDDLLFGQRHYYSVVFRGNGEAVVYSKIVFTNFTNSTIRDFSFELSRITPSEISIYQIKLPQECAVYDYKESVSYCVEWRDPDYTRSDYFYNYYGNRQQGNVEYLKAEFSKSGNLYRFNLPNPVEPYKSSALLVAYATKGFTKKSLGVFKFSFETIKVPVRIEQIAVAINVDSDLILKGGRGVVDYYDNYGKSMVYNTVSFGSISSRELDSIVARIGSYGLLTKQAKNLSPNETFVVEGEYSTSWFNLYLSSIIAGALIIAAILFVLYFAFKFFNKLLGRNQKNNNEKNIPQEKAEDLYKKPVGMDGFVYLIAGLASPLLVVGFSYVLIMIISLPITQNISATGVWFFISGFFITILCYSLIIFAPAILLAVKRGWKAFIFVLAAQLFWFVIFIVLYLVLFSQ